ncbi:uncharacterized protein MKK02DRAFT_43052 [Dioszegia hungarica]|uniref:EamA domain-containing protein n=1 Tax=Dioszegia hungarica TaxID=4972 RepID=A0AA38HG55_9TREE|nr:uncharacterized protein MKK02DRAFT_43052 [Dioszegia hungarica]KAI9638651.1 hypothetical protein MKK02DRAFT_43052 [Dioszegia hungarica]
MLSTILSGRYGGCILIVWSSFFFVGMDTIAQNLIREVGMSSEQVILMRMMLTFPPILASAYFFRPEILWQLNIFPSSFDSIFARNTKLPLHADVDDTAGPTEERPLLSAATTARHDYHHDHVRARVIWAKSLLATAAAVMGYSAFGYAALSDIIAIFNTRVFPAAILCWLLLGEGITWKTGLAALVSTGSVLVIVQPSFIFGDTETQDDAHSPDGRYLGYALAIITTFTQALDLTVMRKLGKGVQVGSCLLSYAITASFFCFFYVCAAGIQLVGLTSPLVWLKLVTLSSVSFGSQCCCLMALQRETAARVSILSYSQIVFAVIAQIIFQGESPSLVKISALVAIMVAGVGSIVFEKPRPQSEADLKVDQTEV